MNKEIEIIEKFIALFPDKEDVMREIWCKRRPTFTKKLPNGLYLTNDPEKMLLCGARIQSSYSPSSPSFEYLPTLVLQPYIGMVYNKNETREGWFIDTDKGRILAPDYISRAFVMLDEKDNIIYVMPVYSDDPKEYLKAEYRMLMPGNRFAAVKSNTPPIEIHLDCIDLYRCGNEHVAIAGNLITCKEYTDKQNMYGVKK